MTKARPVLGTALPGHIQRISTDAVEDEKLGLVYPARVRLAGYLERLPPGTQWYETIREIVGR